MADYIEEVLDTLVEKIRSNNLNVRERSAIKLYKENLKAYPYSHYNYTFGNMIIEALEYKIKYMKRSRTDNMRKNKIRNIKRNVKSMFHYNLEAHKYFD